MVKKVTLQSARSWLEDSQPGYCAGPRAELPATAQPASCVGRSGSFSLNSSSTSSWILAVSVCLSYCRSCPLCASISVSHKHDCRWFSSTVDCKALKQSPEGYRSGPLLARNSSAQQLDDYDDDDADHRAAKQARKPKKKKVATKTATAGRVAGMSRPADMSRPLFRTSSVLPRLVTGGSSKDVRLPHMTTMNANQQRGAGCPLQASRPVFVGVLGDSLAFGGHVGPRGRAKVQDVAWPSRLHGELRANFGSNIHVVNGAARASFADFAALCWDELWGNPWLWGGRPRPPRLDLAIVDVRP